MPPEPAPTAPGPAGLGIDPHTRRMVVRDGVASRLMDTLTGGPFLAGLGLLVGASNLALGLLAALPFLAQVAQLPTLALLLRFHDRRRIVLLFCGIARTLLLAVAVVLVVRPSLLGPWALLGVLAINALLAVAATAAWNWWMRDLLPAGVLGRFFGSRMRLNSLVALGALLAAGYALDRFTDAGRATDGYALLFALGGAAGAIGLGYLARTPHPDPPPSPPAGRSWHALTAALRTPGTDRLAAALAVTAAAVTFALPFVAVFLLRALGMSYLAVTAMTALSQLAYVAGLRGWGHLSDHHGNRGVLLMAVGMLAAVQLGWALAGWPTGPTLLAWVALLHFLSGYAMGGVDLASTNVLLRGVPAQGAPAHLAAVSLSRALVAGLGTVAAGALWDVLGSGPVWTVGAWSLRGFQVLCLIAAGLSLAALWALRHLPEPTRPPVIEVARAMRREVHQMSSIAGIRGLIHAVSYSVELMASPFAAREQRRRRPPPKEPAAPTPNH
jgi:MFS family permease